VRGCGIGDRAVDLDVTDRASVDAAARQIERDFGDRLNVLLNNLFIALKSALASKMPELPEVEHSRRAGSGILLAELLRISLCYSTWRPLIYKGCAE
jgi:NAD(P)-dependent dehydrogenase (short-subunit alcohol dehydrogenase family)